MLLIRRIDSLQVDEMDIWLTQTSPERHNFVYAKRFEGDRFQSILGDVMMLTCIMEMTLCDLESIKIEYSEHGKPHCTSHDVQFSVSHSGEYVICAADDKRIGADIEKIKAVPETLVKKIFNKKEALWVGDSPERFFEVWTAKEAYLKLIGLGVSGGLKTATVDPEAKTVCDLPYESTITDDGYIYTVVKDI